MLDLEPIEKRLHAATGCGHDEDGTWRAERDITDEIGPIDIRTNERQFDDPSFPIAQVTGHDDEWRDATFIEHAPADVRALIAEVRTLRGAYDKLIMDYELAAGCIEDDDEREAALEVARDAAWLTTPGTWCIVCAAKTDHDVDNCPERGGAKQPAN